MSVEILNGQPILTHRKNWMGRIRKLLGGGLVFSRTSIMQLLCIPEGSMYGVLRDMKTMDMIETIPNFGPRNGVGYRLKLEPMADLLREVQRS